MKTAVLLIILLACGLAYIHADQPAIWNQLVKTAGLTSLAIASGTPSASSTGSSDSTPTSAPAAPSDQPVIISPDSTNYLNPDHVRDVEQPPQPGATNGPSPAQAPAAQSP